MKYSILSRRATSKESVSVKADLSNTCADVLAVNSCDNERVHECLWQVDCALMDFYSCLSESISSQQLCCRNSANIVLHRDRSLLIYPDKDLYIKCSGCLRNIPLSKSNIFLNSI